MVSPILQAVSVAEGELRDIQYWNPISGIYESTPPTFSVGHWGGLACRGVNLTGSTQEMYMTFDVIDPRGYLIDTWNTDIHIVPSGGGFSANYGVYCDIVGDYTMQCHLAIAGIGYVDSIWETICHVTEAEVEAFIDTWWLWDAVEEHWVRPSPTLIPLGSDIGIRGRAWNKSDSAINMRMDAVTHSPSGKTRTLTGDIREVPAGLYPDDYPCWDFLWESDEWGDWEADLILYAALPGETLVEVDRRENIAVAAVQEMAVLFQGTISKAELEYDGSRANIPATNIPLGERGLVHIWGRNDMSTRQDLAISWVVRDPDGLVVEEYSDWSYGHGPGDDHEFIGDRFDLNKAGTYTLKVDLLMNPDDPVIVDSYEGVLCTTTTEIPPEYVLIQHTIHPAAYVYEGEDEVCIIEFPLTPDQLPFTQWGGLKLAETFANAVEAEGNSLLEVKVWEDTTPALWTNYRVEIKAAVASEEQGVAVWPWLVAIGGVLVALPWGKIILGALTILGIWLAGWVVENLIKTVDRVIHVPPTLTEEEKQKLAREDLIKMILYEAPKIEYEVSPEDLEKMSDDGLRALLNELIAEAAPPPEVISWLPLVIVGGLGLLGVGAAVALAARPKE